MDNNSNNDIETIDWGFNDISGTSQPVEQPLNAILDEKQGSESINFGYDTSVQPTEQPLNAMLDEKQGSESINFGYDTFVQPTEQPLNATLNQNQGNEPVNYQSNVNQMEPMQNQFEMTTDLQQQLSNTTQYNSPSFEQEQITIKYDNDNQKEGSGIGFILILLVLLLAFIVALPYITKII